MNIAKVAVYSILSTVAVALPTAHYLSARHHYREGPSTQQSNNNSTNENEFKENLEENAIEIEYTPMEVTEIEMTEKAQYFYDLMNSRRSVRMFSSKPFPLEILENIVRTAGTAPSASHHQPWSFLIIGRQQLKQEIRKIIEQENHKRKDLKPIGANYKKSYLTDAPYLIVVCKKMYDVVDGKILNHYYVDESVSIATGILVAAIHNAGLCSVVTTPMNASAQICNLLGRPKQEQVAMLLPVGYAAENVTVPKLTRNPIESIASHYH